MDTKKRKSVEVINVFIIGKCLKMGYKQIYVAFEMPAM
jgi:hypothetical protein